MDKFLVFRPRHRLPFLSEAEAPFERYPGFLNKIVDASSLDDIALQIIKPTHIITHLTNLPTPRRSLFYSTKNPHKLLVLNRGRR